MREERWRDSDFIGTRSLCLHCSRLAQVTFQVLSNCETEGWDSSRVPHRPSLTPEVVPTEQLKDHGKVLAQTGKVPGIGSFLPTQAGSQTW